MIKLTPKPQPTDGPNGGGTVCVITCHNYGRYLTQCVLSVLNQSLEFDEIVIVDDASTDGVTERVCRGFKHGAHLTRITVLRVNVRNACIARNLGVAIAKARPRFYLFMDADNTIPKNYHAELRKGMEDPHTAVTYPRISVCNEAMIPTGKEFAHPYGHNLLRRYNFIDTASLVRSEAFHMAGGWDQDCESLQDWNLWVRVTGLGWRAQFIPTATLNYRQHPLSMTTLNEIRGRSEDVHIQSVQRSQRLTIVTLFSGRDWQLKRYFDILTSIQWRKEHVDILAIDNSGDPLFNRLLLTTLVATGLRFTVHTEERQPVPGAKAHEVAGSQETRRAHCYDINEHLAYLYALTTRLMPRGTDLVWCLEDDVEPQCDALPELVRGLIRDHRAGVVCGVVANRFGKQHLLAWSGGYDKDAKQLVSAPRAKQFRQVTGSGFMCTLFRAEVYNALTFRASPHWNRNRRPYYDWAAAYEVAAMGWKWLIAGAVRCGHREPSGVCVHPGNAPDSPDVTCGDYYDF